jgi:inward rectifier potassium channel
MLLGVSEDRVSNQKIATSAGPDSAPRVSTRLVQREPSDRVVAIGLRDRWLGDLYHHLLTLPWWAFLLGLAGVYAGLNTLFAVLYLLGHEAIANARPGAFSDAFYF